MKPDYHLCDICGGKVPKDLNCFIEIGSHHDGIETVTDGRKVDLCSKCACNILNQICRRHNDSGLLVLDLIDKCGKRTS